MRKGMNIAAMIGVIFATVIMLLPVLVKAEVQTQVTEVASFGPAENNNAEVDNIANDTIPYNIDTWDPLPSGVFVGGTIRESKIQLREYAIGISQGATFRTHYSELMLTTPIKLRQDYVMTGASQFVVRLPFALDTYPASYIFFSIFKIDDPGDYQILRRAAYFGIPMGTTGFLDVVARDGSELKTAAYGSLTVPYPISPTSWAYVRDGRAYCSITAPLHSDTWYLLAAHAYYPADSHFEFYLTAGDLCSDNVTASTIAYEYHPSLDQNLTKNIPVAADLGFSFVFQVGLGINGVSYSRMFGAGDELSFDALIPIGANHWYNGSLNFLTEFRMNASLIWGLEVSTRVNDPGLGNTSKTVLSHAYWTGKQHNSMIVASQPIIYNYTSTTLIDGVYYIIALCTIYIETAGRVQFMLVDDDLSALYFGQSPYQRLWHFNGVGVDLEMIFFNLWSTVSLDQLSLNWTVGVPAPHHTGFWDGVGNWWDKHWLDILGITLIVIGAVAAPFTLGGSLFLLGVGLSMILYNNVQVFRDFVNNIIKFVLDGLEWLGEWLYKIGMFIWKALTWFIDQVIYYGSILIGLLIIAVAIALFIGPIYALIKIMGAFLMMAQGDYEKAAAQISGVVATGKSVVSRLRPGG